MWCWPAMLACAPLTCLLCFLSPYHTHASGSLLFLQLVSYQLAALHLVLIMCPGCPDVWCWLAGYAGMCPSDQPALFSFDQHHTCIWIPPDSAAREWSACCLPFGACCVPSMRGCVFLPAMSFILCALVAQMCDAGRLCWHVPLWLACIVLFCPTPHMHLDPSYFCSWWVIGLLPAMWCLLCALDARMCVPARPCGVY